MRKILWAIFILFSLIFADISWQNVNSSAGFSGRRGHSIIFFKNAWWMFGGRAGNYTNDVWRSVNGSDWTYINNVNTGVDDYRSDYAPFTNNVVIKIHGVLRSNGQSTDRILYTVDGTNWFDTGNSFFPARHSSACLQNNGLLCLFSGYLTAVGGIFYITNEVNVSADYESSNGSLVINAYPGRYEHTALFFNSRYWVIGGLGSNDTPLNDIWSSADGKTWAPATSGASFCRRSSHASIVFDNKMWVIGGRDESGNALSDSWYSADGINWTQSTGNNFSARYDHAVFIHDNKIFIAGGYNNISYLNDIWCCTNFTPASVVIIPAYNCSSSSFLTEAGEWQLAGISLNPAVSNINEVFPSSLFGAFYSHGWNAETQKYENAVYLGAGQGLWIYTGKSAAWPVKGTALNQSSVWTRTLYPGWNLAANPFNFTCYELQIKEKSGRKLTWAEAVEKRYVESRIFKWNKTGHAYTTTGIFPAWEGFWIWAENECSLLIDGNAQTNNLSGQTSEPASGIEWQAFFSFSAGDAGDFCNAAGVHSAGSDGADVFDSRKVPGSPEKNARIIIGDNYSFDYRAPVVNIKIWNIRLQSDIKNTEGIFSWNMSQAENAGLFCSLSEKNTGREIAAGGTGEVKITGSAQGINKEYLFKAALSDYRNLLYNRVHLAGANADYFFRPGNKAVLQFIFSEAGTYEAAVFSLNSSLLWKFPDGCAAGGDLINLDIPAGALPAGVNLAVIKFRSAGHVNQILRKPFIVIK
ncbi:MAG TPA: hypothetical protein DC049_06640 [Spirochaetia bacterium]|nr:hypothetical protein [Spirochaetia bacterium]